MELRKINTQDAFTQWEYTTALPSEENGLTNPYHGVSYDAYLENCNSGSFFCEVSPEAAVLAHPDFKYWKANGVIYKKNVEIIPARGIL